MYFSSFEIKLTNVDWREANIPNHTHTHTFRVTLRITTLNGLPVLCEYIFIYAK